MSLFPGCDDMVEVTDELIQNYLLDLKSYIFDYSQMISVFCTDIFAYDDYLLFPSSFEEDIQKMTQNSQIFDETFTFQRFQSSDFLNQFLKRSKNLILPQKTQNFQVLPQNFNSLKFQIDPEKAQQNYVFYQFIQNKLKEKVTFIDLGAGKGYLSAFFNFDLHEKVIAVEASQKHAISFVKRLGCLTKRFYKETYQKMIQNDEYTDFMIAINYVSAQTSGAVIKSNSFTLPEFYSKFMNQQIAEQEHQKHHQVQGQLAKQFEQNEIKETTEVFATLGLHACGDLSVIALEMLQQPDIKYAFTIPCCYPHLTMFPLFQPFEEICKPFQNFQRPKQCRIKLKNLEIPRHIFNYACADFNESLDSFQKTVEQFFRRAVLEWYKVKSGFSDVEVIKDNQQPLDQFIASYLSSKNIEFQQEDIITQILKFEKLKFAIAAHLLVRRISGQVIEGILLVDRFINLRQKGFNGAIEWCMGGLSGRGFAVWGFKK